MVKEKTRIDRHEALEADRERRRLMHLLRQVQAELDEQEYLDEPYRSGSEVVIPILRKDR